MANIPLGLTNHEVIWLVTVVCAPIVLSCTYVTATLVCLSLIYVGFYLYRKSQTRRISISGQGVLITGCDTGFGHDFAKRMDSLGFTVFAGCLSDQSDGAKSLRKSRTGRLHILGLNITKDDEVAKAVEYVSKVHGKTGCESFGYANEFAHHDFVKKGFSLDIAIAGLADAGFRLLRARTCHMADDLLCKRLWALFNNAGVNMLGDIELCTMDVFYRISEVNMYGMVRVTKAFLPFIRKSKGRIINTTSVKGRICLPKNCAYGITKYGGEAFSDILRLEMRQFGVKVVVIEPGNFGGATGMLNPQSLKALKRDFDLMEEKASPDVKQAYNAKEYLENLYVAVQGSSDSTYPGLGPVIDAMEDAVISSHPRCRYLVGGSDSFYDVYCTLARMVPYLPEPWMDYLVDKIFASGKQ